jgi:hypothetical protein
MNALADFAHALRAAQPLLPTGLRAWNGSAVQARFNVYRNNRMVSLVAALADGFPVVAQLVGEDFFAALARAFVQAHPPRSPVLVEWGDAFADFVHTFMAGLPAGAQLPYLADVARLERARVRAYHAADAAPLPAARLAAALQQPHDLPRLRFTLQPGLGVLASCHPVVTLWQAHQTDGDIQLPDWPALPGEAALVLRQGEGIRSEVVVIPVPAACAHFVAGLQAGLPLAEAVSAASQDMPLDLPAALGLLIQHQAFVDCTT